MEPFEDMPLPIRDDGAIYTRLVNEGDMNGVQAIDSKHLTRFEILYPAKEMPSHEFVAAILLPDFAEALVDTIRRNLDE